MSLKQNDVFLETKKEIELEEYSNLKKRMRLFLKDADIIANKISINDGLFQNLLEDFKEFNLKFYPEIAETDIPFDYAEVAKVKSRLIAKYQRLITTLDYIEKNCCNPIEDTEEAKATGN